MHYFLIHYKILDVSQFKASAEDQVNVTQNLNLFWKG